MANKATQEVGLVFNVNTIRNKMKEYCDSQGLSSFQISGGHKAVTAALEKLWEFTLRECMKCTGKDKSGIRLVTVDQLSKAVLAHVGLEQYYLNHMKTYDATCIYTDQNPVSQADMDKVMERVSNELSLSPKGRNLACYLLNKAFCDLTRTCHLFVECAKKKSIDARCVLYTISCKFHESVGHELRSEVIRAMKSAGEELEDTETADGSEQVQQQDAAPAGEADDGTAVADGADGADGADAANAAADPAPAKEKKAPAAKGKATPTKGAASKADDKKIDVEDDAAHAAAAPADDTPADDSKTKTPAKKDTKAAPAAKNNTKQATPAKKK